jgi:hypothetical protein
LQEIIKITIDEVLKERALIEDLMPENRIIDRKLDFEKREVEIIKENE